MVVDSFNWTKGRLESLMSEFSKIKYTQITGK